MKIRTTLTLQYAGLTAAVFFVFVMAVYYVSEHSRSNAFFRNRKRLRDSILSPFFHSYIFAMYKNEALWI